MSLTSTSTLDEVEAQYVDNASYRENASAAQATLFISACRILLLKLRTSVGQEGASMTRPVYLVQGELENAVAWLSSNPATGNSGGRILANFQSMRE